MPMPPFIAPLFASLILGLLAGCYSYAERTGKQTGSAPSSGVEAVGTQAGVAAGAAAGRQPAQSKAPAKTPQVAVLGLPIIRLAVAELQVIPAYASPGRKPNVEHRMKTSPQAVTARWGRANVRAVGTRDRARVIIRRASIVAVTLKRTGGVSGLFRKEPATRFDGVLAISIEVRDDKGDLLGQVSAKSRRSREVLEGTSEADRKALWRAMAEALLATTARELERQVAIRLTRFAR